jgi:glycosyltransferase involved in cell wall biosynthesis
MNGCRAGQTARRDKSRPSVCLLTGGGDTPYAFGLSTALDAKRITADVIVGHELDIPSLRDRPYLNVLNLRGDQRPEAGVVSKVSRVLVYYARLLRYAISSNARIFHILWNNKFELVDRTVLMLFYLALGKKVVLTAHNVNAGRRDGTDGVVNRLTLKMQYRLAHQIFVHTDRMKQELRSEFGVRDDAVTVIPFGINNAVPDTALSSEQARRQLGLAPADKVLLFFGNIAPYKGLEYLLHAFSMLLAQHPDYKLVVVGRPKGPVQYWEQLRETIAAIDPSRIVQKIEFVPDEDTEIYFKAADVLVLPYTEVFQSGVLFLGYGFGLPALVADVGSLRDDVIEGQTGYVFAPCDVNDLARSAREYFAGELYRDLSHRRPLIRQHVLEHHSWDVVAGITEGVYSALLGRQVTSSAGEPSVNVGQPAPGA